MLLKIYSQFLECGENRRFVSARESGALRRFSTPMKAGILAALHKNIFFLLILIRFSSLSAMTLEEKVGQLLILCFEGREVNEDAKRLVEETHPGGFIFYNDTNDLDSPEQVHGLSLGLQKLSKIPLWICVDQEGG